MNGVDALRAALIADATLTALVPATRIGAGPLPQNAGLPAIALASISKIDRNLPNPGATRFVTERVQVTVLASNYPSQQAVLRALRHAAADTFPTVAGLSRVTIHTDSAGPDAINEEGSIYTSSQDFLLTYSETR